MPRRKRGFIDYACYHITHRCHEREFLFKFSKYRDLYVRELLETKQRFKIDILNYIVTSNHVHLLLTAPTGNTISQALQFLHGSVGQKYNMLKKREGAFWKDRFHATCIQSGDHLARCIFYLDLNMIRAGVVKHPSEWKHSGYNEIMGERLRYRIINKKRLLEVLYADDIDSFRKWYKLTINEKISSRELARQEYWSHASAIGDIDFLESTSAALGMKRYKIQSTDSDLLTGDLYIGKDK